MLKAKALGHAAGQVVDLLAAGASDDDDCGVAVLGKAIFVATVDSGNLVHRRLARVIDFGGGLVLVMDVGLAQRLVDVHHGGVDVKAGALEIELVAGPFADGGGRRRAAAAHRPGDGVGEIGTVLAQGLLQADVGALRLHAEAGAQQVRVRADAQQRHVGAAVQRQHAVVLQQDAALGDLAAVEVDGGLDQRLRVAGAVLVEQLGRGGELIVQRVLFVVFRYQGLAVGAQVGVDGGRVGLQGAAQDQRQTHGEARDAADAAPHCLFARLFHGLVRPPSLRQIGLTSQVMKPSSLLSVHCCILYSQNSFTPSWRCWSSCPSSHNPGWGYRPCAARRCRCRRRPWPQSGSPGPG